MATLPKFLKTDYFLTAAECNAESELALSTLVRHIIESATEHANRLNVGYSRLAETGIAWVWSRLALEMKRMPRVNERFSLETRVTAIDRHSSDRLFEITDAEGKQLGMARTVWVALDIANRKLADLSMLTELAAIAAPYSPACAPPKRLRMQKQPDTVKDLSVCYSDLDINRHLTTTRYIDFMVSAFDMEWHDRNRISRMDVVFMRETLPGASISIATTALSDREVQLDISQNGEAHVLGLFTHEPRQ